MLYRSAFIIALLLLITLPLSSSDASCWIAALCRGFYCDSSCGFKACVKSVCVCAQCDLSRYGIAF
ncbi:hypothetical protein DICVIV_01516 [Dictyocaulus viviparus]|uniref:Uncharacterized protein n=1 Tax=Dictyocaulus viviparus TaxID=29172 RepID=A0A0D8Y8L1_DICVI|nr:hypothetical protein DICVIV_01516 [Dictyocaulus viviparus]